MTKDDIVGMTRDLTQHKADDRVDFDKMLLVRLQKFVQRKRYWWRQRVVGFSTANGVDLYDLSNDTTMGGTGKGLKDIQKFAAAKILNADGSILGDVNPVFDHIERMLITKHTSTDQPSRYIWEPGSLYKIRLDPIPNGVYSFVSTYWWVPAGATSEQDVLDTLLLGVPEYLHHCILDGLVMDTKLFLYGAKDGEYTAAQSAYVESCEAADMDRDFSDGEIEEFKSQESAVNASTSRR